jgi:hypothetical protein
MFQSLAAYVGEGNKLMHLMRECFTRVKIGAHGEFFFFGHAAVTRRRHRQLCF